MMKQVILIAAAALLGSSGAAFATQRTDGVVQDVHVWQGLLRLRSGEVFTFDNPVVLQGLLPGRPIVVLHDGGQGINAFEPHPAIRSGIDAN